MATRFSGPRGLRSPTAPFARRPLKSSYTTPRDAPIDGPPEVVGFTIEPHENLVQMPAPLCPIPARSSSLLPDLRGQPRIKSVPPGTYRLVADFDTTLVEQVFDLPQRQREADVHYDR